ncbi:hypothetical protein F3Y22_tig00004797pilonHSYRG00073 [Hibiscus syriacus]|uniref:Uncharacterized protein n=1 Tax=Hibiscus syriacus TaxID=106335 RepID=A0A6A3CGU0_HIBSY|nr:hypothetical protein F3Y22_tig00004797pilonHSYRG00073 [Hibiscus syriacus]
MGMRWTGQWSRSSRARVMGNRAARSECWQVLAGRGSQATVGRSTWWSSGQVGSRTVLGSCAGWFEAQGGLGTVVSFFSRNPNGSIADEFTKEDLFVTVESVDDETQELVDLRLECEGLRVRSHMHVRHHFQIKLRDNGKILSFQFFEIRFGFSLARVTAETSEIYNERK